MTDEKKTELIEVPLRSPEEKAKLVALIAAEHTLIVAAEEWIEALDDGAEPAVLAARIRDAERAVRALWKARKA